MNSPSFDQYLQLSQEERARQDDLHWEQLMNPQHRAFLAGAFGNVVERSGWNHQRKRVRNLFGTNGPLAISRDLFGFKKTLSAFHPSAGLVLMLTVLSLTLWAGHTQSAPITTLFNTGVNTTR